MKFNIDDYKGKYVMHCKTKEEAEDFCGYLDNCNYQYTGLDDWECFKEDTCYNFNYGTYCNLDWYKNSGYTILEWSDYMRKRFNKYSLRNCDVVLKRNGNVEIVCEKTLICKKGANDLGAIREDLTSINGKSYDIMEVRRPCFFTDCNFSAFKDDLGEVIYKREEAIEMTFEEVCKALGMNIKIVKEKK